MNDLFDRLVNDQRQKVLRAALEIVPGLTADDVMQPNDFPQLEGHPGFRYEEGILEGILTARMAFLAKMREGDRAF